MRARHAGCMQIAPQCESGRCRDDGSSWNEFNLILFNLLTSQLALTFAETWTHDDKRHMYDTKCILTQTHTDNIWLPDKKVDFCYLVRLGCPKAWSEDHSTTEFIARAAVGVPIWFLVQKAGGERGQLQKPTTRHPKTTNQGTEICEINITIRVSTIFGIGVFMCLSSWWVIFSASVVAASDVNFC